MHTYLVSGTIQIDGAESNDAVKRSDERNEQIIFKNCAPFTECISKITGNTPNNGNTNTYEISVPLKYLSKL